MSYRLRQCGVMAREWDDRRDWRLPANRAIRAAFWLEEFAVLERAANDLTISWDTIREASRRKLRVHKWLIYKAAAGLRGEA